MSPRSPDASLQPGRTLYEQFVARGMSKRVVDFLEPIKVDQQQGQPRAAFQCAPTGFVEHLLKHGPVRQPGQGIMGVPEPERFWLKTGLQSGFPTGIPGPLSAQ